MLFDFSSVYTNIFIFKEQMKPHPNFKEAQTTIEFLLGPIKIKDGLFMGDQLAAKVRLLTLRTSNSS